MNKELHGTIEYLKTLKGRIESVLEWLRGGSYITTTDTIRTTGPTGTDVGFRAKSSDSTGDVALEVGSGGTNHGVYSFTLDSWILLANSTGAYFGNAFSTDMNGNGYIDLNKYTTSGHVDKTICDALNSLGWLSDCTES